MKVSLLFLIIALQLTSCSAPKLYQQGLSKIEKAILKDSTLVFPQDTLTVTEYDTVPGTNGKDSLIIQTNTIQLPCEFDVDALIRSTKNKSLRELRYTRRISKDSLKYMEKMYKLETERLKDSLVQMNKYWRQEVKLLKVEARNNTKRIKHETKSSPFLRFVGRMWWLVLIIGFIAGIYIKSFIPKIPNPFK